MSRRSALSIWVLGALGCSITGLFDGRRCRSPDVGSFNHMLWRTQADGGQLGVGYGRYRKSAFIRAQRRSNLNAKKDMAH